MKRWNNASGFTLLEVIVAIMIISTLAVAFAPLIVSSIERIRWAGRRMEDLYAWRSQMELALATKGSANPDLVINEQNDFLVRSVRGEYNKLIKIKVVEVGGLVSLIPRD